MTPSALADAPCLLCGGATRPWFVVPTDWRRPQDAGPYALYYCAACQFGQVWPRPTIDEVAAAYAVDDYYTHGRGAGDAPGETGLLQRLIAHLAWRRDGRPEANAAELTRAVGKSPLRVCDLGCGSGELLKDFAAAGHECVGVEPDEQARGVAQANGLRVLAGTAEALPAALTGERFDLVMMRHVLEHCIDPVRAVSAAVELLAADGKLTVEVPNNACVGMAWAGPCWPWLDVPRHLSFFTPPSLQQVCAAHGLTVERVDYRGYHRQFAAKWLATENQTHAILRSVSAAEAGRPRTARRNLALFLWTALASDARRFDSVGVLCGRKK